MRGVDQHLAGVAEPAVVLREGPHPVQVPDLLPQAQDDGADARGAGGHHHFAAQVQRFHARGGPAEADLPGDVGVLGSGCHHAADPGAGQDFVDLADGGGRLQRGHQFDGSAVNAVVDFRRGDQRIEPDDVVAGEQLGQQERGQVPVGHLGDVAAEEHGVQGVGADQDPLGAVVASSASRALARASSLSCGGYGILEVDDDGVGLRVQRLVDPVPLVSRERRAVSGRASCRHLLGDLGQQGAGGQ